MDFIEIAKSLRNIDTGTVAIIVILLGFRNIWMFTTAHDTQMQLKDDRISDKDTIIERQSKELESSRKIIERMATANLALVAKTKGE